MIFWNSIICRVSDLAIIIISYLFHLLPLVSLFLSPLHLLITPSRSQVSSFRRSILNLFNFHYSRFRFYLSSAYLIDWFTIVEFTLIDWLLDFRLLQFSIVTGFYFDFALIFIKLLFELRLSVEFYEFSIVISDVDFVLFWFCSVFDRGWVLRTILMLTMETWRLGWVSIQLQCNLKLIKFICLFIVT